MGTKTYLAEQYKLMSLKTSDLFIADETEIFRAILDIKQKLDDIEDKFDKDKKELKKSEEKQKPELILSAADKKRLKAEKAALNKEKKSLNAELTERVKANNAREGFVREINIGEVCYNKACVAAIDWNNLKLSRQIQEFCSEGSRLLGIDINTVSWDKIIIAWKSMDILEHIVLHGFTAKILIDGRIVEKKYRFMTASAGQLRRDKVQFISEDGYDRIYKSAYAGLTVDMINAKGGMNVNKLLAYYGLTFSATERWYWKNDNGEIEKFSIRHCLVIHDFECKVPGMMNYIYRVNEAGEKTKNDDDVNYIEERGDRSEKINHCDGIGMKLPLVDERSYAVHNIKRDGKWEVSTDQIRSKNDMVRGPWLKGLLTEFDYVEFCKEHNVPCVVKDFWGKEHDLIKEEIWVLFTESQLKLAAFYDSWEDYCQKWEENDCWICRTNYDEVNYKFVESEYYDSEKNIDFALNPSPVNYQFLQTLLCMSDDEEKKSMEKTREKIQNIASDQKTMLQVMGCDKPKTPLQRCLRLYPALLRDEYCRDTIKQKKKLMTLNAKSGVLHCDNRRVYAIPDMYAACEFWFLGIKVPKGLLQGNEIYCKLYKNDEKLDVLRSPHLYMEHAIRTNVVRPELQKWFKTGGIYTSTHDLISRILQFDVDGDMLNTCRESWMINAAEETIKKYEIIPLFYDAVKASPETVNNVSMAGGLIRAHKSSNIGQISNSLTKLWNRYNKYDTENLKANIRAAGFITYMNNRVIDSAKTGDECNYPDAIKALVDIATGDKADSEEDKKNPNLGKMPFFFQYSKNGRRADGTPGDNCATINDSVMNNLCKLATNDSKDGGLKQEIAMNFREIPNFNYRMLMSSAEGTTDFELLEIFEEAKKTAESGLVASGAYDEGEQDEFTVEYNSKFQIAADYIRKRILEHCDLETAYYTFLIDNYAGDNIKKIGGKRFFWEIFGDIAERNLKYNLKHCRVCEDPHCQQKIPDWDTNHEHQGVDNLHYECCMCRNIFPILNAKDTKKKKEDPCCPDCQAIRKKSKAAGRAKAFAEKQKQQAAQAKIDELKAKILADLQYDQKIG